MKKKKKVVKKSVKKRVLKTKTLGYKDNPTVSLVRGWVTERVFTKAFEAEGWQGEDEMDVSHEWWKKLKRSWKKVEADAKGAIKVTVSYW